MKGEPTDFWGKLEQDDEGRVLSWNPVEAHCADVAACAEVLLRDTLFGARLAKLLGLERLPPRLVARLVVLAALHDLGKYAISFQNRPYPDRLPQGGHVEPIVKALSAMGRTTRAILTLLRPIAGFGESCGAYLAASISHHGRPEKIGDDGDAVGFDPAVFEPSHGLAPLEGMSRLVRLTQQWCPDAFESGPAAELLPDCAEAQHFFAGVVMLADWLGSDKRVFRFVNELDEDPMPLARTRAREIVRDRFLVTEDLRPACRVDYGVFDGPHQPFEPRPAQRAIDTLALPELGTASLTVLEAETGSGKTEAALHRFSQMFAAGLVDGLYFALPTRTSATQIQARVVAAVRAMFGELQDEARPPVVLAVPGYLRVDDESGQALPKFEFLWPDGDRLKKRHRTWAAENTKRFLAGAIVVGTIDQVLLSTLVVSHAHLRASALSRLFLVVDEVHASDAYMNALLDQVLAFHFATGGHALLMSATLGTAAQAKFFARLRQANPRLLPTQLPLTEARTLAYPAIHHATAITPTETIAADAPGNAKLCQIELWPGIDEPERIAARALEAARTGAKVLVIRNTVADAVATQLALEALPGDGSLLFRVAGLATLHHSRFVEGDRRLLDEAVETSLGKAAPRGTGTIVIATQTVQQSLDLDADFLVTDLCPMDVLLQRIGRLHRHARPTSQRPLEYRDARCVVLDPGSLAELLTDDGQLRGGHGLGSVYPDARVLQATRDLLVSRGLLRIPDDSRLLVEETTHPEALRAVAASADVRFSKHASTVDATQWVRAHLAHGHCVDRTQPFGRYGFPDREISGRITTRLGEEDRQLELSTPFVSPFGTTVFRVKVPHWLAPGWPADVRGLATSSSATTTSLEARDADDRVLARFTYDRLGLRASSPTETDADE